MGWTLVTQLECPGKYRNLLVDVLFAIVIVATAATKLRFVSASFGPGEIAGAVAILLAGAKATCDGGLRALWPGRWFAGAWGIFWFCAIAGSLTRLTLATSTPSGFWHNAIAMLFLTGLSWAFWLEYRTPPAQSPAPAEPSAHMLEAQARLRRMLGFGAGLSLLVYGSTCLLTLAGLSGTMFEFIGAHGNRFAGLATNPNQMALMAVLAFCLCAYLSFSGRGVARIGWALAGLAHLFLGWQTQSDIAKGLALIFPSLFFAAFLLTLLRRWLPSWRSFAVTLSALTLAGAYLTVTHGIPFAWRVQQELVKHMAHEREEGDLKYRLMLLENACTVIERSPVWGVGFGTQVEYDQVLPSFPLGREAHNTPVDIALASGMAGLLVAVLVLARAIWNVWRGGGWPMLGCLTMLILYALLHNCMRHPAYLLFLLLCILWTPQPKPLAAASTPDEPLERA